MSRSFSKAKSNSSKRTASPEHQPPLKYKPHNNNITILTPLQSLIMKKKTIGRILRISELLLKELMKGETQMNSLKKSHLALKRQRS
jgi:hypothetical protein